MMFKTFSNFEKSFKTFLILYILCLCKTSRYTKIHTKIRIMSNIFNIVVVKSKSFPVLLNIRDLVFFIFTSRPHFVQYFCKWDRLFGKPAGVSDNNITSSAYIRQLIFEVLRLTGIQLLSKISGRSFTNNLNKLGLRLSPCRTRHWIWSYQLSCLS